MFVFTLLLADMLDYLGRKDTRLAIPLRLPLQTITRDIRDQRRRVDLHIMVPVYLLLRLRRQVGKRINALIRFEDGVLGPVAVDLIDKYSTCLDQFEFAERAELFVNLLELRAVVNRLGVRLLNPPQRTIRRCRLVVGLYCRRVGEMLQRLSVPHGLLEIIRMH